MVRISEIGEPEKIKDIFPVIESAWGAESAESFLGDIIRAVSFHGGLVLGAYEEGELVGFLFSLIGKKGSLYYLYSHMTGIKEEMKGKGVGFLLKQAQKEWALNNSFDLIVWTFDPLMSLNAGFNIRKLGAISRTYVRNFYGMMQDTLNRGVESDRFIAEWWTHSSAVPKSFRIDTAAVVNHTSPSHAGRKIEEVTFPEAEELLVEIPHNFASMKREDSVLATEWRMKTRAIFEKLFISGYAAVSFTTSGERSYYLLSKKLPEGIGRSIFKDSMPQTGFEPATLRYP